MSFEDVVFLTVESDLRLLPSREELGGDLRAR
jgi:hypothetical protein